MAVEALGILSRASGPAIATDPEGRILQWNRSARDLLGYEASFRAAGRSIFELLRARDVFGNPLRPDHSLFFDLAARGEPSRGFEIGALTASGEFLRLAVAIVVVLARQPSDYRLVYLLRRVLRRRRADEAIERILADGSSSMGTLLSRADKTPSQLEVPDLTPRQTEVLRLIARGMTNREIASTLELSVNTVRSHVQSILGRLQVHSKTQAASLALRSRLI